MLQVERMRQWKQATTNLVEDSEDIDMRLSFRLLRGQRNAWLSRGRQRPTSVCLDPDACRRPKPEVKWCHHPCMRWNVRTWTLFSSTASTARRKLRPPVDISTVNGRNSVVINGKARSKDSPAIVSRRTGPWLLAIGLIEYANTFLGAIVSLPPNWIRPALYGGTWRKVWKARSFASGGPVNTFTRGIVWSAATRRTVRSSTHPVTKRAFSSTDSRVGYFVKM